MPHQVTRACDSLLQEADEKLAQRRLAEALALFDHAEAAGMDSDRCAAGRWSAHMLRGDLAAAWRESDGIRERGAPDPHRFWQGEPLAGERVIVRCLHGFGDAVHFLRYLPRLQAIAERVILEVPPKLLKLAQSFAGADEVITWGDEAPSQLSEWTVQMEVMELPYAFRTELHELPLACGYLQVAPAGQKESGRLQVGVVGNAGTWNSSRSIPTACLQEIVSMQGCTFWDLRDEEGAALSSAALLGDVRVDPLCRACIDGLAGRIASLDLVITVDTLAAHMAGALGVPAWVMLQYEADWRWMHEREDSPWYPSLRLFRQASPGDWESVVRAVVRELERVVAEAEVTA